MEDPTSVDDPVKDLGKLKVEMEEEYLLDDIAGKLAIRARETGRLRRNSFTVVPKALPYRRLGYGG